MKSAKTPSAILFAALALATPIPTHAARVAAPSCWPAVPVGWEGVLLISERGRDVVRADGLSDGNPLRPATRFSIASLGKMFTAVAIGQLVDSGQLGFDDPVGRHLPELPPAFQALTIAQLLSHTAGLGDYLSEAPEDAAKARSATDLLPLVVA